MKKFFKRRYNLGYSIGHNDGWSEGFEVGRKKAIAEQRKVILATLQKNIQNNPNQNKNVTAGMEKAIEIIRKIR